MRLVKFNINKKKEIYVNPDLVTTVIPYNEKNTIINFTDNNSTLIVIHGYEYVVKKLTGDLDSEF